MLLAKLALGFCGTLAVAGVYVFHEGILRVDEDRADGRHVHVWVPAVALPMAMYIVPAHYFKEVPAGARAFLPTLRALTKELKKYSEAELVEVDNARDHVRIRTHQGKLLIDVTEPDETVHVACPLAMLEDVSRQLEANAPGV